MYYFKYSHIHKVYILGFVDLIKNTLPNTRVTRSYTMRYRSSDV